MKASLSSLLAATALLVPAAAIAQNCQFTPGKPGSPQAQALAQEAQKTNPCVLVPGLNAKSLSTVWSAMLSSGTTGGKRFDAVPPPGSPTGRVRDARGGVQFDLRAIADEGLVSVQVRPEGAPTASAALPVQPLVVFPVAQLRLGASHDWVIATRKGSYRGSFELLDGQEAQAVGARLDAVDRAALSPQARLLYRAAVLDEAELYGERDEVLSQLRALMAQ